MRTVNIESTPEVREVESTYEEHLVIRAEDGEHVIVEIYEGEDISETKLTADQARKAAARLMQAAMLADPDMDGQFPQVRW